MNKGNVCSAIDCSNNQKKRPDLSFFRFPKEKERCQNWLENCKRADLLDKDVDYLYKNIRLCANHFEDSQFMNEHKKRLVWNAIPTVFNINKSRSKYRSRKPVIPNKPLKNSVIHVTNNYTSNHVSNTDHDYAITYYNTDSNTTIYKTSKNINKSILNINKNCTNVDTSNTVVQKIPQRVADDIVANARNICKIAKLQTVITKLRQKCKIQSKIISRLQKENKAQKVCKCNLQGTSITKNNNSLKTDRSYVKNLLLKHMKKETVDLILSQISKHPKGKTGNRWDEQVKLFVLNILFCSPRAYRLLCKYFRLPGIRTLQKFVSRKCKTDDNFVQLLHENIHNMTRNKKKVKPKNVLNELPAITTYTDQVQITPFMNPLYHVEVVLSEELVAEAPQVESYDEIYIEEIVGSSIEIDKDMESSMLQD